MCSRRCSNTGYYFARSGFELGNESLAWRLGSEPGRLLVACGHIGLVMLIVKSGWLKRLNSRLAAVGQMTLTCYLATSLICTTIFEGYGFGLFAKLQRYQLLYVVFSVWLQATDEDCGSGAVEAKALCAVMTVDH